MSKINHSFTQQVLEWSTKSGRKNLPWQQPRDAYRVWVSEIMLQQTQVKTVIPYFLRFMERFPTVSQLAVASEDEVLSFWSGLGYYSRGRNLHRTAMILQDQYQGIIPNDVDALTELPGIGPSTAEAIVSLAYNEPKAILDANVKRVLSRYFLVSGSTEQSHVKNKLWQLANECMPDNRCDEYTQAIMDLGATCCTNKNPQCEVCPVRTTCLAHQNNLVADYPQKVIKFAKPIKEQQFLVIHRHTDSIYLVKRPPTGIWGGLWCLPMVEINESVDDYVQHNIGTSIDSIHELLTVKHSFSHFHLTIKAISLELNATTNNREQILRETSGRWVTQNDLSALGLAKPIRTILDFFFETHR